MDSDYTNNSYTDSGVDAFFAGLDQTLAHVDSVLREAGVNVDFTAARSGVRNAGQTVSQSVHKAKSTPMPAGQTLGQLLTELIKRILSALLGSRRVQSAPQPNVADEDLPFVDDSQPPMQHELHIPPSGDADVDAVIRFQQTQIAFVENCATVLMRDKPKTALQLEDICRVWNCLLYALARRTEFLPKVQRFFGYYVPTLCKFCSAYIDLVRQLQNTPTSTAEKTAAELEEAFASLEQAFHKKVDELYGAVELDISSDISVLDAMLHKDGLA